jgi:UDP-N-acetylglucosamine 2-epimerase (non-hydrolysing)
MNVLHVVGARPNFMKAAPVMRALGARQGFEQRLLHTGQHFDHQMSDVMFQQLRLPTPDINLGVGSASHAAQTADIMIKLERELVERRPDVIVVYGDVNSTLAAALTASKLQIPIAHVEAGLRSFDRSMPEEINRIVTDRLASVLLTPSEDGDENLLREGADPASIHRVGNVMIDSLVNCLPFADGTEVLSTAGLSTTTPFVLVTVHRPALVDDSQLLAATVKALSHLAAELPVLVPLHPRTRQRLNGHEALSPNLKFLEPLGYFEFLGLEKTAQLVITDSGGVQEETTYLGVPCITIRDNTERPITVSMGTNHLVGRDPERMLSTAHALLPQSGRSHRIPDLWDGHASDRIADVLATSGAVCAV